MSEFEILLLGENASWKSVGLEQALAPVQALDTFAERASDKVTKTKGTFDQLLVSNLLQNTTSHSYYKICIDGLFICIKMLWTNLGEKFLS